MGTVELFEAVVAGGIRDTHFFNGRMLTAGDLRTLQEASASRDRQLGRAIGTGVATGLEVSLVNPGTVGTGARPVLRVTRGLGVSRRGDVLELVEDTDVALIRDVEARRAAAGEFAVCPPPRPVTAHTNLGMYVLTLAPSSRYEGLAPMTELHREGIGTGCGRRYEVGATQFGLVRLDLGEAPPADGGPLHAEALQLAADLETQLGQLLSGIPIAGLAVQVERKLSMLRSVMAHLCLGTERQRAFAADPIGRGASREAYGVLDAMAGGGQLPECDVPLGLVYWSVRGVEFVDMWSVRRPLFAGALSAQWGPFASRRREVEGLATWMQFQQHVGDLADRAGPALRDARMTDFFRFVPPVGVVPVAATSGATGIDMTVFFAGVKTRSPEYVNGARLVDAIRTALRYPSVDAASGELVWRYLVRENMQQFDAGGAERVQPCLMFMSGHVPFVAHAQFDLARWSYANFA